MASPLGFESAGTLIERYTVFLSSSDELLTERVLFAELIDEINQALASSNHAIELFVRKWETLSGFRSPEKINPSIIQTTLEGAHFVVGLLGNRLKSGTKEELEYALENSMDMCVIVLTADQTATTKKYIKRLSKKNVFFLDIARQDKSASALLLRSVLSRTLNALHGSEVNYFEYRKPDQ